MADDFLQQLAEAPPSEPTAADAESMRANQVADAARSLANLSNPASLNVTIPNTTTTDPSKTVMSPRPGSFAYHLSNALGKTYSDPRTAAMATAPGGGSRTLALAAFEALGRHASDVQKASQQENTTPPSGASWDDILSSTKQAPPKLPLRGAAGVASKLASGLNRQVEGLGDLSATAGPGGPVAAFGRVMAAGHDRRMQDMKDRQLMATSNAQMLHEQALTHKMGEDAIKESITDSKAAMDNIITAPPGGVQGSIDFEGKTAADIKTMIDNKQIDPTKQTAFLTGRTIVGKYADGTPKYESTYSVVTPAGNAEISPENLKLLNGELGRKYQEGQVLPAIQLNHEIQQAMNAKITKGVFQANLAKYDTEARQNQISKDAETIMQNPVVTNAINAAMSSPTDPYAIVKAYNAIMTNPNLRNDPRLPKNFSQAYIEAATGQLDPKDAKATWDRMLQDYDKAVQSNKDTLTEMLDTAEKNPKEIEGHTPAFRAAMGAIINNPQSTPDLKARADKALAMVEDVHRMEMEDEKAKAANKKPGGTPGGNTDLTGDAYLQSLEGPERAIVRDIGVGQIDLNRMEYLLSRNPALAEEVALAYPNFDTSKVKGYVKTYQDFTSGHTSTSLRSAGTVLQHLEELKKINDENPTTSRTPGTDAYISYHNKLDTIAGELSDFYQLPKTDTEIKAMTDTLGGSFRRDAAIDTQLQSMGDRLTSIRNTWTNAAPSEAYEAKMPNISPEGRAALARMNPDFVRLHPEFAPPAPRQGAGARPQGVGPDWKQMQATVNGKTVTKWLSPDEAKIAAGKGAKEVGQ